MGKNVLSTRHSGNRVEMIVDHRLPFDKKILLRRGREYVVDSVTERYLIHGLYAVRSKLA